MSLEMNTYDQSQTDMSLGGAAYMGKGDKGEPGNDGFSPVVDVTEIAGGHQINIQDSTHTETFSVMNGTTGPTGEGVPAGGTAGQVLKKKTYADYDTEWDDESTGTTDFDDLTNRPSYNGAPMTHSTNIPEVKTAAWDGKVDKAQGAANKWLATDNSGNVTDKDLPVAVLNRSPGLVGVYSDYGLSVNASGTITARTMTAEQYARNSGSMVLGKGTLENIKEDFLSAYRTASAQDVIDAIKADKPTIKSAMDAVATINTIYILGSQSTVAIVLPSGANAGDQLSVVWYNGATAATLLITGTVLDVNYTPSANSRSEINALWDNTYWAIVTNEQAVPVEDNV